MSKNRLLLIYISLAVTLILGLNFISSRNNSEDYQNLQSQLDEINLKLDAKLISENTDNKIEAALESVLSESTKSAAQGGTEVQPLTEGYITLNDEKWQDVPIYEEKSYSSKVISKVVFDKAYRYSKKEPNWYLISLPEGKMGWVSSRFFKEITDTGNIP